MLKRGVQERREMENRGKNFSSRYRLTKEYIDGKSGDSGALFRVVRGMVEDGETEGSATAAEVAVKYSISAQGNELMQEEENFFRRLGAKEEELTQNHIAVPTDWGVLSNNHSACAMPLLDASLDKVLERAANEPLHISTFSLWSMQLAAALLYLDEKNLCHTDLKPGNILLKKRSENRVDLFVTDFSYAGVEESLAGKRCPKMGTLYWQSPEQQIQQDGRWQIGGWIDIYQFGLILFYMLTGRQLINEKSDTLGADEAGNPPLYGEKEREEARAALQRMAEGHITPKDRGLQQDWAEKWQEILAAMLAPQKEERLSAGELYDMVQKSWQSLQGKIVVKLTLPSIFREDKKGEAAEVAAKSATAEGGEKGLLGSDTSVSIVERRLAKVPAVKRSSGFFAGVLRKLFAILLIGCGIAGIAFIAFSLGGKERKDVPLFSLQINTEPSESKITILEPEKIDFRQKMQLAAGRYLLAAEAVEEGYKPQQKWIDLQKDTLVTITFEKILGEEEKEDLPGQDGQPQRPQLTRLYIETSPSDAEIYIVSPVKIPFISGMALPSDEYIVQIYRSGYELIQDTISLSGENIFLDYTLTKKIPQQRQSSETEREKERLYFLRLSEEMDIAVSAHQIDNLLRSRLCAVVLTENSNVNNEKIAVSFSPNAVLGRQDDILLNIITSKRDLPIYNAFISLCRGQGDALQCQQVIGNLVPCR